jgi:hypothetical protein
LLHSRLNPQDPPNYGVFHKDKSPHLQLVDTDYGLYYGASREEEPGKIYWRTTQFLFPIFTMFPATEDGTVPSHMYTPIDDHLTMHWGLRWHPTRPFQHERTLNQWIGKLPEQNGLGPMKQTQQGRIFPNWWPVAEMANDFLMDREVQRTMNFTGIPTIRLQDSAMITSMGSVIDRTREHLGTTDAMVIATRRKLIKAAKLLRDEGIMPPASRNPAAYRARSCSAVLPSGANWIEAFADWHSGRTKVPPAEGQQVQIALT